MASASASSVFPDNTDGGNETNDQLQSTQGKLMSVAPSATRPGCPNDIVEVTGVEMTVRDEAIKVKDTVIEATDEPMNVSDAAVKVRGKVPTEEKKSMKCQGDGMKSTNAQGEAGKVIKVPVEAKKLPDEALTPTNDSPGKSVNSKKASNRAMKAPTEAGDATRAEDISARTSDILMLVQESFEQHSQGNTIAAKRLALQAMLGASKAMDEFLQAESDGTPCNVNQEQLHTLFSECARVFTRMEADIQALRCFYTGAVFSVNWNEMMYKHASQLVWERLFNPLMQANIDKIYDLLDKMFTLAKTAEIRRQYHVAIFLAQEMQFTYLDLILRRQVGRRGASLPKPGERMKEVMKPVHLLEARCFYNVGELGAVKKICTIVLTYICDDYDCVEALELWAQALLEEQEYSIAEKKIRIALQKTKQGDEDVARLTTFLEEIGRERDVAEQTNKLHPRWLDGTTADTSDQTETKAKPEEHQKEESSREDAPKKKVRRKAIPKYKTEKKESATVESTSNLAKKRVIAQQTPQVKPIARLVEFGGTDRSRCSSECSVDTVTTTASGANSYYSGKWSTPEDSEEDTFSDTESYSSNSLPEIKDDDTIEETSFYEQSCSYYYNEVHDETEITDGVMLQSGIELNESYIANLEIRQKDPFEYEKFLPKDKLKEMMLKQPDVFIRCKLQIENAHLCHCTPVDSNSCMQSVEISGRCKAGQVYNEDEVVVELLDPEHDKGSNRNGKVVGVWERKRHKDVKHPVFLCTLDDKQTHFAKPMCKTVPKVYVLSDPDQKHEVQVYTYDHHAGEFTNQQIHKVSPGDIDKYVFLVAMIYWKPQIIYPTCAIIKILPYGESLNRGFKLLSLKHNVPYLYPRTVVERTESITLRCGEELDKHHLEGRLDLTDQRVFTIDPAGSRDLDDALSIEREDGGYIVGVHIADVSHFVQKGDPNDVEAQKRTTTFYPGLVNKLPRNMLPEPFSTKLCSLLPNRTRLTLSVFFHLESNGKVKQMDGDSIEVAKSFIRSCKQFTYRQVQDIIEDKSDHILDNTSGDIKRLYKLAFAIRKHRLKDSMLALDSLREEEAFDDDDAFEAHFLVEEFMIMANEAIAAKLVRHFPDSVPLRCQPEPTKESMETFLKHNDPFIDTLVKLQDRHISDSKTPKLESLLGTSAQQHATSFIPVPKLLWDKLKAPSTTGTERSKLLRTDDLYPLQYLVYQHWIDIQKKAEYRCHSSDKKDQKSVSLRHFNLAKYPYTHFTSPIRRYVDLVIHRLLHAALDKGPSPYTRIEMEDICNNVNSRAKHAKDFQRECKVLKQAVDLKTSPKMTTCFIDEVSDRGITVCCPDLRTACKELAFSLLDVSFKPDLGTDSNGKKYVRATWTKRLYDTVGVSSHNVNSNFADVKRMLNPSAGTVSVPLQKWARIVKCAIDNRLADLKHCLKLCNVKLQDKGVDDVSTESLDPNKMQPFTTFSLTFKQGQSLQVQVGAGPRGGLLTPQPVLYNMTNNVNLCLQHMDDPVLHLSHYSTSPTCPQYTDVDMYLGRWLPILEMEAADCAVKYGEECVINNVPIKFKNSSEGKITFPLGFCEVREIIFSGTSSENDSDEYFEDGVQSFDWLCLRKLLLANGQATEKSKPTSLKRNVWVGHAKVTSVTKKKGSKGDKDGKIVVWFRLHSNSPAMTHEIARPDNKFQVEVIRKSEVDRRTESVIQDLRTMNGTLAHTIALNKGAIPKLDKEHIEMANVIERDLYIPSFDDVHPLPRNNHRQQEAIDKALKNRFTLIQGPPGTGKTYTGIKLVYLFDKINHMISREGGKKRQVLFCGPSNASVDLVAKLMLRRLGSLCPKFVRVYGRLMEAVDYPIPGRTFITNKSTRNNKPDRELSSVTLHHLIRQKGKQYAEKINELDRMFRESKYAPQSPKVMKEYADMIRKASIDEMRKHSVILCTTVMGSNPKVLQASSVFQIIVDEAGMCPEPQCMVPIIATKAEQVVLIGDHKQLRPIIKNRQAQELGLKKSLFERYAESGTARNVQFTMLDIQYRMNPQLCRLPSEFFYKGLLTTAWRWWDKHTVDIWPKDAHGTSYPHVFIPVKGEERTLTVNTAEGNENSKSNQEEIEAVVKVFRHFLRRGIYPSDICVMSQYNAQREQLQIRLTEELKNDKFQTTNVKTVVSSQGGEWDYVIFSTVRSLPDYKIEKNPTRGWRVANLGFITDKNQINVALTRARKGLVIIGNDRLLSVRDSVFRELLMHYESVDCVLGLDEFPLSRQKTKRTKKKKNQETFDDDTSV